MVKLMTLSLSLLRWLKNHKRLAVELFLAVLTASSLFYGTTVHNRNKVLSQRLEIANNNIEAYQELVNNSGQASGVLKVDIASLKDSKDDALVKLDSVRNKNKIKAKDVTFAATQNQSVLVTKGKGVQGDLLQILKDTIYNDSLQYNEQTKVYYNIGKDTVDITIDLKNTQYLYTYKTREYKNKKNFFQRLFTFDWKKVDKYKYTIENSNPLVQEGDIRIVEQE